MCVICVVCVSIAQSQSVARLQVRVGEWVGAWVGLGWGGAFPSFFPAPPSPCVRYVCGVCEHRHSKSVAQAEKKFAKLCGVCENALKSRYCPTLVGFMTRSLLDFAPHLQGKS